MFDTNLLVVQSQFLSIHNLRHISAWTSQTPLRFHSLSHPLRTTDNSRHFHFHHYRLGLKNKNRIEYKHNNFINGYFNYQHIESIWIIAVLTFRRNEAGYPKCQQKENYKMWSLHLISMNYFHNWIILLFNEKFIW